MSAIDDGKSEGESQPTIAPHIARDLNVIRGADPHEGGEGGPARRRRRPRFLFLLLLLGCAAAAALAWRERMLAPPQVSVVAVSMREVGIPDVVLAATGYLVPRRQITVSSRAQGKIVEMPVVENQHVEAGALLARIENDEQQAHVRLSRAQFHESKLAFERATRLHDLGAIATSQLDSARTGYEVAEARLELTRVGLENTEVRAPIAGTVIRKLRDVGEFLTIGVTARGDPGTAVVTLADLSAMDVALEINETEIQKIAIGDVAIVAPEALRKRRYLADVTEVAAMADRQKGMVPVKVRLRRPDVGLKPEMTARVSFLTAEPSGDVEVLPTLPAAAVTERDGRKVVFVIEEDRIVATAVEIRPDRDDHVALLSGPDEGTYVVENPPAELRSGQRIRMQAP
jgi:HlyD family secretion protein